MSALPSRATVASKPSRPHILAQALNCRQGQLRRAESFSSAVLTAPQIDYAGRTDHRDNLHAKLHRNERTAKLLAVVRDNTASISHGLNLWGVNI